MKIVVERILVKKKAWEAVIGQWYRPRGFDLSVTELHDPMLKLRLNLVVGSFEEFKRFVTFTVGEKIEHTGSLAYYLGCEDKEGTNWHFVNVQKNDWTADDYGLIVHELHHFTHGALSDRGVSYGTAGEEVYAYLQEYFMKLVVKALVELTKVGRTNKRRR